LWAEACRRVGDHQAAVLAIAEAKQVIEATAVRGFEPYVGRIEALLLQDQGADTAQIEACLQRAIALARQQRAKISELRTTIELARLWQGQGRTADARGVLKTVYGGFTEGLHTADLRTAKLLLDQLG
jgi:adenylate cyclase